SGTVTAGADQNVAENSDQRDRRHPDRLIALIFPRRWGNIHLADREFRLYAGRTIYVLQVGHEQVCCLYGSYCGIVNSQLSIYAHLENCMRHICSRCKLTSADGNLWCQEIDCPAGTLPALLRYGDYLGNLKIIQLKRVLRNTTIYKAERSIDDKRVETFFLKVANPGAENEQYLCEEAAALQRLCDGKAVHPALPVWRHHGATNGQDPFGIVSLRDQTRFYYLMD